MNAQNILQKAQVIFLAKINEKNSWGKHEIELAWKDSLLEVLFEVAHTEVPQP